VNEKWSEYISEYPSLSDKYKHVAPYMVHGLLARSVLVSSLSLPLSTDLHGSSFDTDLRVCVSILLYCRLRESENKKKRKFHSQSAAKKDRQKYYELILKKLEEFMST
jgi:hypothetical protein